MFNHGANFSIQGNSNLNSICSYFGFDNPVLTPPNPWLSCFTIPRPLSRRVSHSTTTYSHTMSVTFSNVDAAKHILEDAQDITGFDSKAMQVMLRSARSLLEDIAAQRGAELDSPRFPMPYCGFLKVLNYDVRVLIYRELFRSPEPIDSICSTPALSSNLSLLRVCRHIYNEATPILYGSNTFNIDLAQRSCDPPTGMTWLRSLPPLSLNSTTSLTINGMSAGLFDFLAEHAPGLRNLEIASKTPSSGQWFWSRKLRDVASMSLHIKALRSLTRNTQVKKISLCDGWPTYSVRYLKEKMSANVALGKDSWDIPWGLKNVRDRVKKELAILALPPTQIALALSGGNGRERPLDKKL
jgi:hypothetical protein